MPKLNETSYKSITEPLEAIAATEEKSKEYRQLSTINIGSTQLLTAEMPYSLLQGKSADPKQVVASRRKSPGPGEYKIVTAAINVKPKLQGQGFESKAERFQNFPLNANTSTSPSLGPGYYKDSEELQK